MKPPRWTPITLAALCVLTTSCTSGGDDPPLAGSSVTASAGDASPTPTGPTGLTPEDYRSKLRSATKPVGSSLGDIAKARTIKSLGQRLDRAESALSDAVDRLGTVTPPAEVGAEHADYVSALRGLQSEMGDLRDAVDVGTLCTSSAVLARLGKSDEFGVAKGAAGDLGARGDYPADVVKVKTPKEQSRRLKNGSFVRSGGRGGRGNLRITNGNPTDAVITLARGKSRVLSVYVRRKSTFTVSSIRDGTYRVYFTSGKDWDRGARAFTRNCVFQRFDDTLPFKTVTTATQIQWSNWRISLNRIVGGNASTSPVKPEDFPV